MSNQPEVRYQMLRPAQVRARRAETPVVYIPIGTLEWHGPHNPIGADTLQAEGLAIECARKGGGLVFPPLYYGESRVESLMEANAADRDKIAEQMGLSPDNFLPEKMPHSPWEQTANYHNLLLHILAEAQSLGFKLGVLVAGHYPLIDHAQAAVLRYNRSTLAKQNGMLAWACGDWLVAQDRWPDAGDHAGGWETSHILAMHPDTVDLSALPTKESGEPFIGVGGSRDPRDATAAFGRETTDYVSHIVVREVQHRLENPRRYWRHGAAFSTGLWKENGDG